MRKLIKFVLILAGIFVVLLAGAALYIKIKYPPEKIKSIAVTKLSELLKRNVSLGEARFDVMSGFVLKDLKISNRPGWAPGNMVAAKNISISYHLYDLVMGYFSNQVILGEIKLDEPKILIERRGLNSFNFTDILGETNPSAPVAAAPAAESKPAVPPTKAKPKPKAKKKHSKKASLSPPKEGPAFSSWFADQAWAGTSESGSKPSMIVSISSISINHGKVEYRDETISPVQTSDLKDLNLKVKNISMIGGKTTFNLSTPFVFSGLKYDLAVDGVFHYFHSSKTLKGMEVKGTVNGLGFGFSGDALDMGGNLTPDIKGNASLNMLQFSGLVPKSLTSMPDSLTLTGPAEVNFHLTGKIKSGLEVTGLAEGSALAIKYKDLFVKPAKSTCSVDFKSVIEENGSFDIPTFKVIYQDWEVTGAFHHKNGLPWACEVHSKSLPFKGLPGMLPKLKSTTLVGGGSLDIGIGPGKGAIPININGKVVLKGVGISLPQGSYFQDMNGPINISDNVARVPSMTFQAFEGSNALGVTLNGNTSAYTFAFNLKNVNGQKAVNSSIDAFVVKSPEGYKDKLYGSMNMVFQGSGRGFSAAEMESSLAGSGTYNLVKAKVKGYAAIKIINGLFGEKTDEFVFDKIDGNLLIKKQVLSYTANTVGRPGTIKIVGGINFDNVYTPNMMIWCDLKRQYLDSEAVQKLLPGMDPNKMECIKDAEVIPVDCKFTGPAKDNNYSWDRGRLEKFIGDCVAKKVQQLIKQKSEEVGKDLGDKLKGLFGK